MADSIYDWSSELTVLSHGRPTGEIPGVRKSLRLLHDLDGSEKIWLKLFLVNRAGAKEDVWLI